jgi:hypothetical protein
MREIISVENSVSVRNNHGAMSKSRPAVAISLGAKVSVCS